MTAHGWTILAGDMAPRMAERTTLRLGGRLLAEVHLEEPAAAAGLGALAARLGGRLVTLGAGSNILAGSGELPLVAVRDATPPCVTVVAEEGNRVHLRAAGSTRLPVLVGRAAALNLAGLEGLTGIPGSVGGAVAMNAGSYGQCVADALVSVTVVDATGTVRTLARNELDMRYRHMDIPGYANWFMVLAAEFCLTRDVAGAVAARARAHMAAKRRTQPVTAASAGCVFKNPAPDMPAGKLLDEVGFRGKRIGGMVFSAMHANFMVNEGQGISDEALELVDRAREAVTVRHGVALALEVRLWV